MIWLALLALGCGLWMLQHRVATMVLFLFYLTNGFQLIPAIWFDTGMGIQKGADFALLLLFFAFSTNFTTHIQRIRDDAIARTIVIFLGFVIVAIAYSRFELGYDFMVIMRAARRFFFLLGYFVFRQFSYKEVEKLLHIIVGITFVQCLIFLAQVVFGVTLLNRSSDELTELSDRGAIGEWKRLYNLPEYTLFSLFYLFYSDRFKAYIKIACITVLSASFMLTLHRSWITWFIIVLAFVGLFRTSGLWKKIVLGGSVAIFALIPAIFPILGERMDSGIADFKNAVDGGYNIRGNRFDDSFSFRIAHVLERWDFVTRDATSVIFGLGFLTEDASQSQYLNFSVGWADKYGTRQIDTADISWSLLFLWCGVVGALLYTWMYWRHLLMMWKQRSINVAASGFSFMLLYFLTSFTSTAYMDATTFIAFVLVAASVAIVLENRERNYNEEVNTILASMPYRRASLGWS